MMSDKTEHPNDSTDYQSIPVEMDDMTDTELLHYVFGDDLETPARVFVQMVNSIQIVKRIDRA